MKLSLASIAEIVEGTFTGDGNKKILNVASFEMVGPDTITFAGTPEYIKKIPEIDAGAVIVPNGTESPTGNIVYSDNPRAAFSKLMDIFNPIPEPVDSIHPTVVSGARFKCGSKVTLGPGVVIGDDVVIGDRVSILPNTVIGNGVMLGDDVSIHPNVSILDGTILGSRVTIHSGTVIGSDGYGFVFNGEQHVKIRHIGIVRIDDDVEIGANCTIDRGTYGETWIKKGVKTDNQVHIAHNVVIGENTLLVAQVGIAGSTEVGNNAILAGRVGVAGHLKIGNNTIIGPGSGILKSVPDNQVISGVPGIPHKKWLRAQHVFAELPEMKKQLRKLDKIISKLESTGE